MIGTGLVALMALTRSGIRHFWASHDRPTPRLRVMEGMPIAVLLGICVALTMQADGVMRFTEATANALHAPGTYVRAVMSATPKPGPTTAAAEGRPEGAAP
jgi:multicomponent K+:H+ antiporter subunit D